MALAFAQWTVLLCFHCVSGRIQIVICSSIAEMINDSLWR